MSIVVELWLWRNFDDAFGSRKSGHAGFEKVELSAAVHLALDELQLGD